MYNTIVINRQKLLNALEKCAKLSRTWPIYAQFARVKSEDSKVIVESANSPISIRVSVDTDTDNVAGNVEFTLHCRETIKYLQSLKTNTVAISYNSDENKTIVNITDENGNIATFNNIPSKTIPALPSRQFAVCTLSRTDFVDLFDKVSYAADKNADKLSYNGCLIILSGNKIQVVATNGARLAVNALARPTNITRQYLIYARAIEIALKLIKINKNIHYVTIWQCDRNTLSIAFENVEIFSCAIEEEYPNWQSAIPGTNLLPYSILAERKQLIKALEYARDSYDDKYNAFVTLEYRNNLLVLHTEKITTQIPATSNMPYRIVFRIKYLLDVLERLDSNDNDYVTLRLGYDNQSPAVIECDNFKYVVMPAG